MSERREKVIKASNELESLIPAIRDMVNYFRDGAHDPYAYAAVYWLRRRIGYIVRDIGPIGIPSKQLIDTVEDWAMAQMSDERR